MTSNIYGKGKTRALNTLPSENFPGLANVIAETGISSADLGSSKPLFHSLVATNFGCKVENGIPVPVMATGDPAPPELVDVIRCQCKAKGEKCSTTSCSCHKEHTTSCIDI